MDARSVAFPFWEWRCLNTHRIDEPMNPAIEQMLMSLAVMIDEQVDAYDWYHRQKVAFLQHRTAAAAVADGDWQAVEAFLRRVQADLARERQDLEDSHAPYFVAAPMQDLLSV